MTVDGKDVRGYANYLKTPNAPGTNQSLLKENINQLPPDKNREASGFTSSVQAVA
jgi:hypothetical protein